MYTYYCYNHSVQQRYKSHRRFSCKTLVSFTHIKHCSVSKHDWHFVMYVIDRSWIRVPSDVSYFPLLKISIVSRTIVHFWNGWSRLRTDGKSCVNIYKIYLYRQSLYPKPWSGECHIPVTQRNDLSSSMSPRLLTFSCHYHQCASFNPQLRIYA